MENGRMAGGEWTNQIGQKHIFTPEQPKDSDNRPVICRMMLGWAVALLPPSFSKMQSPLLVILMCFDQRAEMDLSRKSRFLKVTAVTSGFGDQYSPLKRMF